MDKGLDWLVRLRNCTKGGLQKLTPGRINSGCIPGRLQPEAVEYALAIYSETRVNTIYPVEFHNITAGTCTLAAEPYQAKKRWVMISIFGSFQKH